MLKNKKQPPPPNPALPFTEHPAPAPPGNPGPGYSWQAVSSLFPPGWRPQTARVWRQGDLQTSPASQDFFSICLSSASWCSPSGLLMHTLACLGRGVLGGCGGGGVGGAGGRTQLAVSLPPPFHHLQRRTHCEPAFLPSLDFRLAIRLNSALPGAACFTVSRQLLPWPWGGGGGELNQRHKWLTVTPRRVASEIFISALEMKSSCCNIVGAGTRGPGSIP